MKFTFIIKNAKDILEDRIRFDQVFPDAIVPEQCKSGRDISIHVPHQAGEKVEVGDVLVEFYFYRTENTRKRHYIGDEISRYKIFCNNSGYICHSFSLLHYTIDSLSDPIVIYSTLEEYQEETYPIGFEINKDEFTSESRLIWKSLKDDEDAPTPWNYIIRPYITLEFTIEKRLPVLAVHYLRKFAAIRRKDTVSFKFTDGTVLNFPVLNSPVTSEYSRNGQKVSLPLNQADIEKFSNCGWDKLRIEHINGDAPRILENNRNDDESLEFAQTLFKKYAQLYKQAMSELNIIPDNNNKDSSRDIETAPVYKDACYVYLMVDTSNGYHKIGISNRPDYREKTLQSEKPTIERICAKQFPSRLIAQAIESALHTAFAAKRVRGEWFNLTEEEVKQIIATLS